MLTVPDLATELPHKTLDALEAINAVVVSADGDATDYLTRTGARAIVIRPDRHILGVAQTAGELDLVLAQIPTFRSPPAAPPRMVANV